MDTSDKFDFEAFSREAAERLRSGASMVGENGVFTPLLKKILEAAMEGELDAHLEETRQPAKNRRNGRSSKQLHSALGDINIEAPRDRNGTFTPKIVEKRKHTITSDIDQQIINLYGSGMSYKDIRGHLSNLYGIEVSDGTLNAITDRLIPVILEWQSRPLESVYPIIWLDAMYFKVRENGEVVTKAIYSVLGVNMEGEKDVLAVQMGAQESSRFWRQTLHELQSRGVKDIFVACIDNLTGFAEAIEDIFPKTDVQLCLVHQMRNSMKYINDKDMKLMVKDLKKIYTADNENQAMYYLELAEETWGKKYTYIFKSWRNNWERLMSFYKYPPAMRRLIYTTNPIESYHRMIRKVTKTKGAFTSETAILKLVYLSNINAKSRWSGSVFSWTKIRLDLVALFEDRIIE